MDNSGRPLETEMIDGEPYSVDELINKYLNDSDFDIWFEGLSPEGQDTVDAMIGEGK